MKELCRFSVAGVQYSDYQFVVGLKAGRKAKLVWERSNVHDNMAIRVDIDGVKVGYVPRGEFQRLLHEAREMRLHLLTSVVAYNKTNPTWAMLTIKVETKNPKNVELSDFLN